MRKLFIVIAIFLMTGCVSTKFTYIYKSAGYDPTSYKKLAVLVLVPNNQARIAVEDAVVSAMKINGIHAVSTWSTFQFANDTAMIRKAGFAGEKRKEIIKQKVADNHIDALLIISLFNKKKEQRYVPGNTVTIGVAPGYPVYGYPYYGYYDYAYVAMSTPGYYTDESTYFLESNLYDVASEKLLWTGQTSTQMYSSLESEAVKFANLLVKRIITDSKPGK